MHKSAEAFLRGDATELPVEINYYTQFFTQIREHPEYKLHPEMKIALDKDWVQTEWDSPSVWFKGIVDLLIEAPKEVVVYDWKTGKEYDEHRLQRELYGVAALSIFPQYDTASTMHVYFDSRQNRPTVLSRNLAINVMLPAWNDRVSKMFADKEYIPSPGYYCRYCPYSSKFGQGPCRF
jgi:hypothetical protein